jgi:hypothetical protein
MSKVNTHKNIGHTSKTPKAKSISNGSYKMLLAVSMAPIIAMCISTIPVSINIAH